MHSGILHKLKVLTGIFAVLVIPVLTPIILSGTAEAAPDCTWKSPQTLDCTTPFNQIQETFTTQSTSGPNNANMYLQGTNSCSPPKVNPPRFSYDNITITNYPVATGGILDETQNAGGGGGCLDHPNEKITFSNTYNDVSPNSAIGSGTWTSNTSIDLTNTGHYSTNNENFDGTYTQTGSVNNGVMTLNGPKHPCGTPQLVIGDASNNISYQTATTASLNVKVEISTAGAGPAVCDNPQVIPVNMTNVNSDVVVTAQWLTIEGTNNDPTVNYASMKIQNVAGLGSFISSGEQFDRSKITGNDMLLSSNQSISNGCYALNQYPPEILVKNYTTATTATLQYWDHSRNGCVLQTAPIDLTNIYGVTPTNPGSTSNTDGCAITDDSPLRFLLCPLFLLANNVLGVLNGIIQNMLYTPVDQIFANNIPSQTVTCTPTGSNNTQTCKTNAGTASFQATFNAFRNLGIGLMIIAGVVMVGAQAAGLEIFSAYTVRKALPRILTAIIGMVLCWPVLKIAVIFFNDLGVWASSLILLTSHVQTGSSFGASDSIGLVVYLLGATGVLVIALGWGILGLIGAALLAFAVGFIVIAIVKLGTIILILTFPLAIAFSVLPGTQKFWKLSRDGLIGLLMAFPIIMAFLAAGKAASSISAAAGAADSGPGKTTWYFLAFIVLIAPYFLLTALPRMIGGVFGAVHGLVGGHSMIKGGFDKMQKFRQGEQKYLHDERMAGRRGLGIGRVGGRRFGSGLYQRLHTRGGIPLTRGGANAYHQQHLKHMKETAAKAVQEDNGHIIGDDTAMQVAAMDGMSQGKFIKEYARRKGGGAHAEAEARHAAGAVTASFGEIGSRNTQLASWMARAQSNTGYDGSEAGIIEQMNDSKRMVDNGLISQADAIAVDKANGKNRPDQNGTWGAWFKVMAQHGNISATTARDTSFVDENGKVVEGDTFVQQFRNATLNGMQMGALAGAHTNAARALAKPVIDRVKSSGARLQAAVASGVGVDEARRDYRHNIADWLSVHDYASSASPQVGRELADTAAREQIFDGVHETGQRTLQQVAEDLRSDDVIRQRRREYGGGSSPVNPNQAANANVGPGPGAPPVVPIGPAGPI